MSKGDGWVKIYRRILTTELTASQFKFFVGAILLAKSPKSQNSGLVDLSVRELAKELHMSRSEVCRRERDLEAMGMLSLLKKGFLINNYHYYQVGKSVPPTGQSKDIKDTTTVPPTEQSVPSRIAKSAHKNHKNNKTIKKGTAKKRSTDPVIGEIFKEMKSYLGYPEVTSKDPIPNYGKEGNFINRMLGRGFTSEEILACWKRKVDKRGGNFVSMVYVNEDIRSKASSKGALMGVKIEQ